MEIFNIPLKRLNFWPKVLMLSLPLCLLGLPAAASSTLFYNNDLIDTTTAPVNTLDPIDAINFVNDSGGVFTWNYYSGSSWPFSLYHSCHNALNFTNNGTMESTRGFWFDTQKSTGQLYYEANTFYNSGTIHCGLAGVSNALAGISVWATNVLNPGTLRLGLAARGKISGHNLDFNRGYILMDNPNAQEETFKGFSGQTGAFGLNTNAWNPRVSLHTNDATASLPYPLSLANSTVYLNIITNFESSNIVVRAIFASNLNSNTVTENHYFGTDASLGAGQATVEWISSYQNPYDGTYTTNYLYLNNDYNQSIATNIVLNNNIPDNFSFLGSSAPSTNGLDLATITGFQGFQYPAGGISNRYSYTDVKLISTSVDTNTAFLGILTNLPGRVEITASNWLNLSLSTISGMNYLRLNSTNQYDNDGNSVIQASFSDSYLGSTNGNLVVSNLYGAFLPSWSGRIQAWSTQFTNAAGTNGFSYEYKVLLVRSAISPFTTSQQQDFVLYSSNNVVISDTLNILRTLSINSTNLLVTDNGTDNGAHSFQGELNLNSSALHWETSLPRLRNLTNQGVIRTVNQALYGSAMLPYFAFVNTGVVTNGNGAAIVANDFETSNFFSAGNGSFSVQSLNSTITNGVISAAGTFSNISANLNIAATVLTVGKSITLYATNLLTDTGEENLWTLGNAYINSGGAFSSAPGLTLRIKPDRGDLLATTIQSTAPSGTLITHTWSGTDYGSSVLGFNDNAAIGQLVLDAQGPNPHTQFVFKGPSAAVTNALYVDRLVFSGYVNFNTRNNYTNLMLTFSNNLVLYYAQAINADGIDISDKLNGFNGNHLRWVPSYAGRFSSTSLVYPSGETNVLNTALITEPYYDSDGDGIFNAEDTTPLFVSSEVDFTVSFTNLPPQAVQLQWVTIPNATNYVYYTTNLLAPVWAPLTNFSQYYYGTNLSVPNPTHVNWFVSPQSYPGDATNVWVFDPVANTPHFYKVMVQPNLLY